MKNHKPTKLKCSHTTALIIIYATILLFLLIGCSSLFRSAGLTDEQAAKQIADLQTALANATTTAIADIQTGLTEGHNLKTIAVKTGSTFLWKMIAAAGATVGVVLNGLLAKWLGTERKITKTLITSIEREANNDLKSKVKAKASAAGIEPQLHARVNALT